MIFTAEEANKNVEKARNTYVERTIKQIEESIREASYEGFTNIRWNILKQFEHLAKTFEAYFKSYGFDVLIVYSETVYLRISWNISDLNKDKVTA